MVVNGLTARLIDDTTVFHRGPNRHTHLFPHRQARDESKDEAEHLGPDEADRQDGLGDETGEHGFDVGDAPAHGLGADVVGDDDSDEGHDDNVHGEGEGPQHVAEEGGVEGVVDGGGEEEAEGGEVVDGDVDGEGDERGDDSGDGQEDRGLHHPPEHEAAVAAVEVPLWVIGVLWVAVKGGLVG